MHRLLTLLMLLPLMAGLAVGVVWLWHGIPGARPEKQPAPVKAATPVSPQFAELPWLRDETEPRPAKVGLAFCPWTSRRAERAGPTDLPLASTPWPRDISQNQPRVAITPATVPWQNKP